jgi:hypothetical protein
MALNPRQMLGLANTRPSMQYQQLNNAYQSDPRRMLGQTLMGQGASAAPVRTPLQGLGRLSSALVGAYLQRKAGDAQVAREDDYRSKLGDALSGLDLTGTPGLNALSQVNPELALQTGVSLEGQIKVANASRKLTDERTSAMKNAEAQGLVPGTPEYNAFIDKSSSGITVNTGNKKAGDAIVTTLTGLADSATSARQTMSRVEQMSGLLDAGLVTGFGAETVNSLRRVGQFFNPDYKLQEVAGAEAFIGNANAMIGPLVKQLGSNPTDKDLKFFETASPTVTKTVEGNKLLLKGLKLKSARQAALSEAAQDFMLLPENEDIDGFTGLVRLQRHLSNFVKTSPLFQQGGKLLLDEYTKLNGSPPPSTSGSALDDLIDLGLVAN